MEERLFGGKWETWDEDGVPEGKCVCAGFKHSFHVQWDDGSSPVQFRFTGRQSDRFWFECHGDAVSAVFNGNQMTWDDGCIWKTGKSVDIVGTTIGETILESGVNLTNALGNDGVGVGFSAEINCEAVLNECAPWIDTKQPCDPGDDSTGAKEFTTPRKFFDTGISSENQWEFLMKSYNDLGYGNWTASLDHDDKDQGVGSGATYCFYLYGYFDLAKEWESKLQGYNEVVKEWESKLQGYNDVSYQLDGLPLRQVNRRLCCGGDMEAYWTYSDMTGCFCIANRDGTWIA